MSQVAARSDAELYEDDFVAWTQSQAAKLRRLQSERANVDLDLPHLAEEIEDLGNEVRNAVRSQVRRIIEHCLKLEYSPAPAPRAGWVTSVIDARIEAGDRLTPTVRRDLEDRLAELYGQARRKADIGLRDRGETAAADALPKVSPYTLDRLLDDDWYPTNRYGLTD